MDQYREFRHKNLSGTYIAGKVTDCPNYRELFTKAEGEVARLGLIPISPINIMESYGQGKITQNYNECIKTTLTVMMRCKSLYVLNNYKTSRGALLEIYVAEFLGMEIIYQPKETEETRDETGNLQN